MNKVRTGLIILAIVITITAGACNAVTACLRMGIAYGKNCERLTWQSEIVSRGYGEWVQSKEDPTRNVFAWKEK